MKNKKENQVLLSDNFVFTETYNMGLVVTILLPRQLSSPRVLPMDGVTPPNLGVLLVHQMDTRVTCKDQPSNDPIHRERTDIDSRHPLGYRKSVWG